MSADSGARYNKSAKRIMSFKSILAWTLKSICKEFSDLDLKYIERNCIGDVSISNNLRFPVKVPTRFRLI